MSDLVQPSFKENVGECGCGCDAYGTLKSPWRDGSRCVARKCCCKRCLGKVNRAKGDSKARQARKRLNLRGANTRHEEHAGGAVRWEAKTGAQCKPLWTAYLKAEAQSEAQRPMGDNRPFLMTAGLDGTKDQLVIFRLSRIEDTVAALAEQFEGGGAA